MLTLDSISSYRDAVLLANRITLKSGVSALGNILASSDWFYKMTPERQDQYLKKYPNSQFSKNIIKARKKAKYSKSVEPVKSAPVKTEAQPDSKSDASDALLEQPLDPKDPPEQPVAQTEETPESKPGHPEARRSMLVNLFRAGSKALNDVVNNTAKTVKDANAALERYGSGTGSAEDAEKVKSIAKTVAWGVLAAGAVAGAFLLSPTFAPMLAAAYLDSKDSVSESTETPGNTVDDTASLEKFVQNFVEWLELQDLSKYEDETNA